MPDQEKSTAIRKTHSKRSRLARFQEALRKQPCQISLSSATAVVPGSPVAETPFRWAVKLLSTACAEESQDVIRGRLLKSKLGRAAVVPELGRLLQSCCRSEFTVREATCKRYSSFALAGLMD